MLVGGNEDRGDEGAAVRRRDGLLSTSMTALTRALAAESDRWFLWLPVLFAGGIHLFRPCR